MPYTSLTNPTTVVDLSSNGSTRLIGQVTVANPTTSVSLSSQITASVTGTTLVSIANPTTAVTVSSGVVLGAGSSENVLGAIAQGAGSTSIAPWYVISSGGGAGSTVVDAQASSFGSTRLFGQITVANPTTSVSLSSQITASVTGTTSVTVTNPTTVVDLSSNGSTRLVGQFTAANPTTAVTVSSGVILGAGSTANSLGSVALLAGVQQIGSVDLASGGSTRFIGMSNYESFTVSSRTSVASSADIALFAATTAHRARIVQNQSTAFELLLNLSTNAVSSASTGSDIRIPINGYVSFGGQTGTFPLYVGAIRCKIASTTVGAVAIGLAMTT